MWPNLLWLKPNVSYAWKIWVTWNITAVKERGIKPFIQIHKERKDCKNVYLKNKPTINVHEKCRLAYNKKSNIKYALIEPNVTRKTRSSTEVFDFKNFILFCGNAEDGSNWKNPLPTWYSTSSNDRVISRKSCWGNIKKECDKVATIVFHRITNLSGNVLALDGSWFFLKPFW